MVFFNSNKTIKRKQCPQRAAVREKVQQHVAAVHQTGRHLYIKCTFFVPMAASTMSPRMPRVQMRSVESLGRPSGGGGPGGGRGEGGVCRRPFPQRRRPPHAATRPGPRTKPRACGGQSAACGRAGAEHRRRRLCLRHWQKCRPPFRTSRLRILPWGRA